MRREEHAFQPLHAMRGQEHVILPPEGLQPVVTSYDKLAEASLGAIDLAAVVT